MSIADNVAEIRERIAGPGTEECIRRASAEGHASARFFFGQLDQHQQDEKQAVHHEDER